MLIRQDWLYWLFIYDILKCSIEVQKRRRCSIVRKSDEGGQGKGEKCYDTSSLDSVVVHNSRQVLLEP